MSARHSYLNRSFDLVTLDEVKSHLRILHNKEDGMLRVLLASAVTYCEDYLGNQTLSKCDVVTVTKDKTCRLVHRAVDVTATDDFTLDIGEYNSIITFTSDEEKIRSISYKTEVGLSKIETARMAVLMETTYLYENRGDNVRRGNRATHALLDRHKAVV